MDTKDACDLLQFASFTDAYRHLKNRLRHDNCQFSMQSAPRFRLFLILFDSF
jgi:hypothetical protein